MSPRTGLAGVVLAAGRGERLRPLTDIRPKPLCPIANRPMLDYALDRLAAVVGQGPTNLAVNAHWLADRVADHVGERAHLSIEQPVALGTAGALGALHDWLDGRDVLLTNADSYLTGGLDPLTDGWDGQRIRLLGKETHRASDFGTVRYVGTCLLPWAVVAPLEAVPSGLYELVWRSAAARGGPRPGPDRAGRDRLRSPERLPGRQPARQRRRLGRRPGCGRRGPAGALRRLARRLRRSARAPGRHHPRRQPRPPGHGCGRTGAACDAARTGTRLPPAPGPAMRQLSRSQGRARVGSGHHPMSRGRPRPHAGPMSENTAPQPGSPHPPPRPSPRPPALRQRPLPAASPGCARARCWPA